MLACASKLRSLPSGTRFVPSNVHPKKPSKPTGAVRNYPRVALFGDNHFQDRGLPRIVKTGEWIADELKKRKVDSVVCLGDVLNTREQVSVRALSAALSFFDGLAHTLPGVPIHILLGNHDINLKHSRKFSSLDALGLNAMSDSGLILHRELTTLSSFLPDVPAIMVPYHEDPTEIAAYLDQYAKTSGKSRETLIFGHLSIAGAQQNHSPYRYRGPLKTSNFASFKRTFSGHFHHHHVLGRSRVVYVGSPMQFNFGDAGDTRGIVIYDTETDRFELVPNPHGEAFIKESEKNLKSQITALFKRSEFTHLKSRSKDASSVNIDDIPDNRFKDKFVQVIMDSSNLTSSAFDELRDSLLSLGAAGVSKTSGSLQTLIKEQEIEKNENDRRIIKHFGAITTEDIEHIIVNFANSVRKAHLEYLESLPKHQSTEDIETSTSMISDAYGSSNSTTIPDSISQPSQTTKSRSSRRKSTSGVSANENAPPSSDNASAASKATKRKQTIVQQQSGHFLEDDALFKRLVSLGTSLASKAASKSSSLPSSHSTFPARLHSLYLKNFMGVQGELTIPFFSMNSGIWLIEGTNGAGKSTIFEALVWAQFGEFLRSGMQKDYAINDNTSACTVRLIYENGLVIERSRKRNRSETLRTYQLKNVSEKSLEELSSEEALQEALRREKLEEETLLMNRESTDLLDTETSVEGELDGSRATTGKKSKKSSVKSAAKGGKSVKGATQSEFVYEAESELGDLRNTQKQLSDRLGVNFETFTKSVVLGQNILHNFVAGGKDKRRAIIEEMLGLDKFNDWFDAAKLERLKLDEKMRTLLMKKAMLQEELNGMSNSSGSRQAVLEKKRLQLDQLKEARERIVQICDARIAELEAEIEEARAELQLPEILELIREFEGRDMEEEGVGAIATQISNLVAFESRVTDLMRHLQSTLGNESQMGTAATCASCGQEVTVEHIESMIGRAWSLAAESRSIIPSSFFESSASGSAGSPSSTGSTEGKGVQFSPRGAYNLLKERIELSNAFKIHLERKVKMIGKIGKMELSLSRLETSLANARTLGAEEVADVEKRYAACEAELEQLAAMRAEQSETEKSLQRSLEALELDIEATSVELSMTKFWEMAFDKQSKGTVGTVRAFVFEDIVKELNAICGGYMEQLQTKEQYNLKLSLTADLEMEQVYGKRSGGERKRTDLAILFALFELVRSQSRFVPDFLMLDEVFDALDHDGRHLVGQVLSSLSKRLEKILVITHTDVASGLSVAGTLDVKMPYDAMGNPMGTEIDVSHR